MDNNPSTSNSGLLNVGRSSIRRLAHAVKRKQWSPTTESAKAPAAKAPTRSNVSRESQFIERKYSSRRRKTELKQNALPEAAAQQHITEAAGRASGQKGTSASRQKRGRKSSMRATKKVRNTLLISWPFKQSHGKLDLQNRPSQDGRTQRGRSKREKAGAKINPVTKTKENEPPGSGTSVEGTLPHSETRASWKDDGGDGEDGAQRRARKRRRRRKSQSDADDFFHDTKAPQQSRVVATGLCTPKRPKRGEQTRRCKPKQLSVPKEEFLSLKKKLEWELTFNLYCRQKKEFMEINKSMYECDDCDAHA